MTSLRIGCVVRHEDEHFDLTAETMTFLKKHLQLVSVC
jgi:hypothetical protein